MRTRRLLLLMLLLLFISFTLSAWTANSGAALKEGQEYAFSLAPVVSVVMGHSNELVFDSSSDPYPYLSRLHWQIHPAVVAGAKGSFNLWDQFFINAAVGTAVNKKTGWMTDHDWISDNFPDVSTEWTHESVSDIELTSSFLFDGNAALRLYNRNMWKLDAMIGFKYMQWAWTDTLVSLTYPGEDLDYLIGQNGIDYNVKYKIPYLGVSTKMDTDQISAGITLLYSFLVSVDDHDYHKLRGLHFYDTFSMGQYLGFSAFTRWHWSDFFSLGLSYDVDWVPEIIGDVSVYDNSGNSKGYYINGAGVSYLTTAVSLALEYNY
jgi:plasminogen activator